MTLPFTTSANNIPNQRLISAIQNGVDKKILFSVGGGLGDQICAEPTIRYAAENFKDCEISVLGYNPFLFKHTGIKKGHQWVGDFDKSPSFEPSFILKTFVANDDFTVQFFDHKSMNSVDYSSVCALKGQLPIADREIHLSGEMPSQEIRVRIGHAVRPVFVHPGRGWPSKSFPPAWWMSLISWLEHYSMTPILIGADSVPHGTAELNLNALPKTIDLRNKLSILESIWLLQRADALVTNDSAPLHMTQSRDPKNLGPTGQAFIGFVATTKHPDLLMHFRHGVCGWRMKNFSKGGYWAIDRMIPNRHETLDIAGVDPALLATWLPDPQRMAEEIADVFAPQERLPDGLDV